MDANEAALLLGVHINAPKKKIDERFRKLMVLNHPDCGGSPYLAAKINEAKATVFNHNFLKLRKIFIACTQKTNAKEFFVFLFLTVIVFKFYLFLSLLKKKKKLLRLQTGYCQKTSKLKFGDSFILDKFLHWMKSSTKE
ncbi:mitochondrial import inner membrane translocase subunit TIM14 [Reticulomyxa filosa]|uniref:Mitochondrial import inner membrane translocase subunit TIM14 n=1 Tax=Reticulomyxa filosa TaxID=46433 RepID=X6P8T2_RETFI|nr:mitochondrial import inner membrane translocase subunit TIM14 [Reticulomyxa filosa]|eukprot:ETO34925.1 mitochondrial import inner membrane translocase subunit TIM14 [Reticulomyxa filosa]